MNESNMENEKTPLYVAFSTQKGGVGKTTFTVLAASYLYYLKGYDVAVVDCDYPQHSIAGMRKRDAEQVGAEEDYKRMAYEQFTPGMKFFTRSISSAKASSMRVALVKERNWQSLCFSHRAIKSFTNVNSQPKLNVPAKWHFFSTPLLIPVM